MRPGPWGKCILVTISVVVVLCLIGIRPVVVQGTSMEPTLRDLQILLMVPAGEPEPGEIYVFRSPSDGVLIKRLIAVPGDTLQITDGSVIRNGSPEQTAADGVEYAGIAAEEILLSADQFFFLSDNDSVGIDSRYETVGIIRRQDIIGRVVLP